MEKTIKILVIFFAIIALLGFIDATYLTAKHFSGEIPPCSVQAGCENVLTSEYSKIFGIPTALLGAFFYFGMLIIAILYLEIKDLALLPALPVFSSFGFVFSLWMVYLQLFVIQSICTYCMGSAATSTLLFITSILILRLYNKLEYRPNIFKKIYKFVFRKN